MVYGAFVCSCCGAADVDTTARLGSVSAHRIVTRIHPAYSHEISTSPALNELGASVPLASSMHLCILANVGIPGASARRSFTIASGAGFPDCFTNSLYFLEFTYALYVFSLLNFFFVKGSSHVFVTAVPVVGASFSFLASNHSRVTGGRLAILRFKLYLQSTSAPEDCKSSL